jgi:hypothetical protein
MHPIDAAQPAERVVDRVQAVAGDAPDPFDADMRQGLRDEVGDRQGVRSSKELHDEILAIASPPPAGRMTNAGRVPTLAASALSVL